MLYQHRASHTEISELDKVELAPIHKLTPLQAQVLRIKVQLPQDNLGIRKLRLCQ
jgi:hypothetical protein